jgi:NAD(P)-dependent dehydrogenase (short-subunit alcohol dehydrogenase family)
MQIKDRVFIVTGASSGIGLTTAIALSDRGAKVALLARSTDALKKLAQQLPGSLPVTVDMTQFDRVREAVGAVHRHYGRIDGLVNNAGRSYAAAVEEIDPVLFDEIFHLNVLGPIVAMQAVIPLMRGQGGGSIVNINSGTAFMTVPQYSVTRVRSGRFLDSVWRHAPSWKRIASSSVKSTRLSRRRTLARTGWEIRPKGDRHPITPTATSPNLSPVSSCKRSKKVRPSISRMIVFAKWPGSVPRRCAAHARDLLCGLRNEDV